MIDCCSGYGRAGIEQASYSLQFAPHPTLTRRKKSTVIRVSKSESFSSSKIAVLSASRKKRVKLPIYEKQEKEEEDEDGYGRKKRNSITEFLNHPSGMESLLNTKALISFHSLDSNTYRCNLPGIQLLKFEVNPVVDLRITPTTEDCVIEMLSCKFEGSQIMERQNDHFSAFLKNHITWDANASEPYLDVYVKLDISLEIYTQPFIMLPVSAVEKPGNMVMQALVDRLVPALLQQLIEDYDKWVKEQCEITPLIPQTSKQAL